MKPYQVVWSGPVGRLSGLGNASREYVSALRGQGVRVHATANGRSVPLSGSKSDRKVLVFHHSPHKINLNQERKRFDRIILNTVWETTLIPRHWRPNMNKFDAICVPSQQNRRALIASGVKVPIYIVSHGVNASRYKPGNSKTRLPGDGGKFVFLSVFTFQHRKNPEALLRAYWEEFKPNDPVLLVIKTSGFAGDNEASIRRKIEAYKSVLGLRGRKTAPLVVIGRRLDDTQLKGLYARANAFVLPTRGEGVGLPFLEALASGVPVIATGWGGHMDFLHSGNSFLVDYNLQNPGVSMNSKHAIAFRFRALFAQPGQRWAEPSIASLRKQMRAAFRNPALCREKGKRGRADVAKLTWARAGSSLKKAIEQVLEKGTSKR
ncbi:glycosyltransferase family 4 protein [Gorillibacterium timonense]|uniref:glycosyltransferase family 4 protein n=1 Tax=Gorillibacterium timonense TaxID=1689269 RepID=UPI00071CE590|nr:glycosyltransferase family 4 protein [Gorillibacterium timonense]